MSTQIISKKIKLKSGNTFTTSIENYMSAEELVNDCDTRKSRGFYDDMKDKTFDSEWSGVGSYQEALDLLKNGYQPTVDIMKKSLKFNKQGAGRRIAFENNVHGFAPIVPLAMKGVPNSMINMTMKPIKCKVIDVYYDLDALSSVSSETIIECGQKLLQVIIELEKQGYKFNLYAMQSYTSSDSSDILSVRVKSSNQPFDLKRMSFPLTHSAFLRVIGFDWQGKCPFTSNRGYGRGSNMKIKVPNKDDRQAIIKSICGDNAVYIPMTDIKNSIRNNDDNYVKEALVG